MKSILFVSNKDGNLFSFRKEVIVAFKERGYDVTIVCPQGPRIAYFTEMGCRFEELNVDRRGKNPLKDIKWMLAFKKIIKTINPNVVCTYTTKVSIYAGIVCRLTGVKYIINNSGLVQSNNTLLRNFLRILYKIAFSKAACMMYQNKSEQDYLNSILGGKVHTNLLPGSGVNLSQFDFREYPSDNDGIIFNYVARIEKDKGIEELLECAKSIKQKYSNVRFRLFGDFDQEVYKAVVTELDKEGVVEYMGRKQDLRPYIESSHAIILPSYHEGMANVILEHAAMGRPALASDVPGCKEPIDNGVSGFTFNVKDAIDLTKKVEQFLALSNSERSQMGLAARKKMEEQFDRQLIINCYEQEAQRLINE